MRKAKQARKVIVEVKLLCSITMDFIVMSLRHTLRLELYLDNVENKVSL